MSDIHAIIAAAKRGETDIEYRELLHLRYNSIAMAEALVSADRFLASGRPADAALVIGDCLDKIVKEAKP